MGKSRVEKYRDYRKNMIGEDEFVGKSQIETELKPTTSESSSSLTAQELTFIKKINNRKIFWNIAFILSISIIFAAMLVFGLILF